MENLMLESYNPNTQLSKQEIQDLLALLIDFQKFNLELYIKAEFEHDFASEQLEIVKKLLKFAGLQ